jgi:hypothetical protein
MHTRPNIIRHSRLVIADGLRKPEYRKRLSAPPNRGIWAEEGANSDLQTPFWLKEWRWEQIWKQDGRSARRRGWLAVALAIIVVGSMLAYSLL